MDWTYVEVNMVFILPLYYRYITVILRSRDLPVGMGKGISFYGSVAPQTVHIASEAS